LIGLGRITLILAGFWKDPILRGFEHYGDDERLYNPLPGLLLWSGVLLLGAGIWADPLVENIPTWLPGLLLINFAYSAHRYRALWERFPFLLALPRWSAQLREYTDREERRRIAYNWLDLSWRTRLLFNGSDRAFLQWADLIVMATVY
jgi:hypothetical protein